MRTNQSARTTSSRVVWMAAFATVSGVGAMTARADTFTYGGGNYTQDFDHLQNASMPSYSFAAAGPFNVPDDGNPSALTGWQYSRVAGTATKFNIDNGSNLSGSAYSYGTTGSPERALGSNASGTSTPAIGAVFVNNSTQTYTGFSLSFTGEQWRRGTAAANTLAFSFAVGNSSIIDTTNAFTSAAGLSFTAPNVGGSSVSLDGNLPINQTNVSGTVGGLSWAPGQSLVIRWTDTDDGGNDDGLGIDNLTFAGATVPTLTWAPGANRNWNTGTDANFNNGVGASTFTTNSIVNFTNTGVGSVNVDAAGVSPSAVNISNTSGTYIFQGGPINGGAKITKTGGGTAVLAASNGYTGGTQIDAGVLSVSSNDNLGNASGPMSMNGGTLQFTGNVAATARTLNLNSLFTESTIDTGANTGSFLQIQGQGDLTKVGSGTLITTFTYGVLGQTHLLGGTLVVRQTGGSATFTPGTNGGNFLGHLVVDGTFRMDLQDGVYSGGGSISVLQSGAALSNAGLAGQFPFIQADIHLNENNVAQPFVTTIGGVGGNQTTIDGVVSGNSDVNIASAAGAGGGSGTIIFNKPNTWTGNTTMNNGSVGFTVLGVTNALPSTTGITWGTASYSAATGTLAGTNGPGILDLNGKSQTLAYIATGAGTNATVSNARILSTNGLATLTVNQAVDTVYAGNLNNGTGSIASGTFNLSLGDGSIMLVKNGVGKLTLAGSNTYTGGTVVNGGVLQVNGANAWAPVIANTDIRGSSVIFDYNDGSADPASSIQTILTAGYGVNFATGAIRSTTAVVDTIGLGWKDDTAAKQVTVRRVLFGDADLNGSVDTIDFGFMVANFAQTGKVWANADFNYDGTVNSVDFNLLVKNFSQSLAAPAAASALGGLVPEPATFGLLGLAGAGLAARRRRR